MPALVDYSVVLDQLTRQGLKSLYHNSGAFGFAAGAKTISRGWIGADDPAIRESVLTIVRHLPPPIEETMTKLAVQFWQQTLQGAVWVMPKSHWAYELEFGNRDWLSAILHKIDVDASALLPLNNAAAIEFAGHEAEPLRLLLSGLLTNLAGSDFEMVFHGRQTICTIHHRRQLWWTTTDPGVGERLDILLGHNANIEHRTSNIERRSED